MDPILIVLKVGGQAPRKTNVWDLDPCGLQGPAAYASRSMLHFKDQVPQLA